MKKLLILLLTVCLTFCVACGNPDPENPTIIIPPFSPSAPSDSGSSGSSGSLPNIDPPADLTPNQTPSDGAYANMYRIKISLGQAQDGRYTEKIVEKEYIRPESDTSKYPVNKDLYPYIAPESSTPKEVYDTPFAYDYTESTREKILNNYNLIADFNANKLIEKAHTFIRYIYCQTDGDLLLSVTYDTSTIYQTDYVDANVSGGYVIRAYVTIEKRNSTGPIMGVYNFVNETLNAALKDPINDGTGRTYTGTLMQYFCNGALGGYVTVKGANRDTTKYNYEAVSGESDLYYQIDKTTGVKIQSRLNGPFFITPISSEIGIAQGNGFWADIYIGVPLVDTLPMEQVWTQLTTDNTWYLY